MQIKDLLLEELAGETAMTRKMLERVPFHEPAWKPHEKSMSIQRLASHIAELPLWFHPILELPELDFLVFQPERFLATDQASLLAAFDAKTQKGMFLLQNTSEENLLAKWRLRRGDLIIYEGTRYLAFRKYYLSHIIHHRGQLSVYLRLTGEPVPGMYGPSADDRRS